MNFKCCFKLKGILLTKETLQKIIDEKYTDVKITDITEFVEHAFQFLNEQSEDDRIHANIEFERDELRKLVNAIGGFKIPSLEWAYEEREYDFDAHNQKRLKEIKDAIGAT